MLIPFVLRHRVGPNGSRMLISAKARLNDQDMELYQVDGEFLEAYAYDPIEANNEYGIPTPYGILDENSLPPPVLLMADVATSDDTDGMELSPRPFLYNTTQRLRDTQGLVPPSVIHALLDRQTTPILMHGTTHTEYTYRPRTHTILNRMLCLADDDRHANPRNSIKMCTIDFRDGFCAAMTNRLVALLGDVKHDVLVMTRCQLKPEHATHKQYINSFKTQTTYTDIGYNIMGDGADVIVATMAETRHYTYLSETIRHEAGLPSHAAEHENRDTMSTAANRRSILTTSYASIPIDILVASEDADPAQVVQRLNELRLDGRRTERHAILITASQRRLDPRNLERMQGPYEDISTNTYGYDYPIWHTKHLSLFRILEPPRHQTLPIEARFRDAGISMELRVLEFPTKIQRHRAQPSPVAITPAEWREQDMDHSTVRVLEFPTTNRTPTAKPT